jgi:hypothetical protein
MMKKLLLLLVLACFSAAGFAQTGATGDCTWTLTGSAGNYTLTISGNGAMENYIYSSVLPWSSYRSDIKTLIVESGVTTIGDYAFSYCDGLTSVTISNSVTTVGIHAFDNCTGLTSVTIPNSVTTMGDYAFNNCDGLTSVSISNSVTTIGSLAFASCTRLTSVTIPNSVTTIGSLAFSSCISLTSVTIPNSVTAIGNNAFASCVNLTSVTIPNLVTAIEDYTFYNCTRLTSVTIPNSVTTIGIEAFCRCSSLTSVTIPNSVTTIGNLAFSGCSSLTSVSIPSLVTTIGVYAFSSCSSLTSVSIPSSVTTMGAYAFYNCSSLTSVSIPSSVTTMGYAAFGDCINLRNVTVEWETPASLSANTFNNVTLGNVTLYVPSGKEDAYRNARPGFKDYIPLVPVSIAAIPGVTAPDYGAMPVTAVTATAQYSGTVSWLPALPASGRFEENTVYTATITLTPELGYTLTGVAANSFTVAGASVTHAAGSGLVRAEFPVTVVTDAETPALADLPQVVYYEDGTPTPLTVTASVGDGGTLTYQWFRNLTEDNTGGELIVGATTASYSPPTDVMGTVYYYVTVTNTNAAVNNRKVVTVTSPAIAVTISRLIMPVISRKVTLDVSPYFRSDPAPGVFFVESARNLEITLTPLPTLPEGYEPQVTTNRTSVPDDRGGVTVTRNEDGSYTVRIARIQQEIRVTVTAVSSLSGETIANERVAGAHVWYHGGLLHVDTPQREGIAIYSIAGRMLYRAQKADGVTVFDLNRLPRGVLIVRGESGWTQKIVR